MFFTFDGLDGTGKTTQIERFCAWLDGLGYDVVACRDPGSTPLGEQVRTILLESGPEVPIGRRAEMLLYMASRAQLVDQVIRPALDEGKVVVADRFLLANVVYQGYAGGLDVETLWQVGHVATGGIEPTLTFLLDMPPDGAAGRLERPLDRMEQQGSEYRRLLREGFLAEARRNPDRIVIVNAERTVDEVAAAIRAAAQRLLPKQPT